MFMKTAYCLRQAFTTILFFSSTAVFSQMTVTVTDSDLHGWLKHEQYLGKISFANGPKKPPLQNGSLQFDAPVNGHGRHLRMRNSEYAGILLSTITELRYSTFIQKAGANRDAPLLVLLVDTTNDGIEDTHLSFVPRFQNPNDTTGFRTNYGWFKPKKTNDTAIRWQHAVRQKVWQTWDAFHGAWNTWPGTSETKKTFDAHPPLLSLASFIAQHPKARIVNDSLGGGVRIQAGGIPMADHFLGNADAFAIGINGKTTIYDFEVIVDVMNKRTEHEAPVKIRRSLKDRSASDLYNKRVSKN
jgi:hypothetical protein